MLKLENKRNGLKCEMTREMYEAMPFYMQVKYKIVEEVKEVELTEETKDSIKDEVQKAQEKIKPKNQTRKEAQKKNSKNS